MPIELANGQTVLAAIFSKTAWPSAESVDNLLYVKGYNADDFHVEESETNYRVLFPTLRLGIYDSASTDRVVDQEFDGVSYVTGKESPAFAFDSRKEAIGSPILFDVGSASGKDHVATFTGLKVGKFKHSGREFEITSKDLENMVANFNKRVLKKDLPIDYSHNDHERAAGWITGLALNDEKTALIVTAKFTPAGAQALESKEFRYFSADFYLAYSDPEDGREYGMLLRGGALTNIPFIKEAEIVPLSEDRLAEFLNSIEGKKTMSENIADLKADLKLAQAKVADLEKEKVTFSDAVKGVDALKSEIQKLSDEKKALEVQLSDIAKDQEFAKLLAAGKACEAQREAFKAGDMIKFAELAKPINVTSGASASAGNVEPDADEDIVITEVEKKFCEANGIDLKTYKLAASKGGRRGFSLDSRLYKKEGK